MFKRKLRLKMDMTQYIKPELLVLIPVCLIIGLAIKHTEAVGNKYIPLINGIVTIVLSAIWIVSTTPFVDAQSVASAIFIAIIQGVLCAGAATYGDQLIKQAKKEE